MESTTTTPSVSKRQFQATVVRSTIQQTCIVMVERMLAHPKYGKRYRRSRRFQVHDATGVAKEGMIVMVEECRPISKTKRWRLLSEMKTQ